MASNNDIDIQPPKGRLGVLLPGMGAVATTFIAGVFSIRRGLSQPIGSLTQLGTIRIDEGTDSAPARIRDILPLAELDDLVFGGWDIFDDNAWLAAKQANVLLDEHLAPIRDELESIAPWPGVFDEAYVKRLRGEHIKHGASKMELADQLISDISSFRKLQNLDRLVCIWCGSTEAFREPAAVHSSVAAFEKGLRENDESIAPSQIYAYACLREGIPFANGSPQRTVDVPALVELSERNGVPVSGKDFKTGQSLLKTILAPGFKARMLGIDGWFSTNILGNRDGRVLSDPESFQSKEVSKLGVLDGILEPHLYPLLYANLDHQVRIDYYRPRGDEKESWDSIDLKGWMGYPMQLKVNFLCRDSILAAPVILDLVLFLDLAQRAGLRGVQDWLSFYWKSPMSSGLRCEHDLFIQLETLENTLRRMRGTEELG